MSKTYTALFILLSLVILISGAAILYFIFAGNNSENNSQIDEYEFRYTMFSREDFLYDFDYMIAFLENNYPFFPLIYEKHGVDMRQKAEELRHYIAYEAKDLNWSVFFNLLRDEFFRHANYVGHLAILSEFTRQDYIRGYEQRLLPYYRHMLNILNNPLTDEIYSLWFRDSEFMPLSFSPTPTGNINTRLIQQATIGVITINAFPQFLDDNDRMLLDEFYRRRIANAEHLIIDIRNVSGGVTSYFNRVVAPLINTRLFMTFESFFASTDFNMEFVSLTHHGAILHTSSDPYRKNDLHALDLGLDRKIFTNWMINPDHPRANFNGKIWLLVGENNGSAAQIVAEFYKYTGFATLVGEVTRGSLGAPLIPIALFTLPKTGILIQFDNAISFRQGSSRPLDMGTVPHYFNREGMDAMETVLALIAEGEY